MRYNTKEYYTNQNLTEKQRAIAEIFYSEFPKVAFKNNIDLLKDVNFLLFDNEEGNIKGIEEINCNGYELIGLAKYSNTFFLNIETINKEAFIRGSHHAHYDSNIIIKMRNLFTKEHDEHNLFPILEYIVERKIGTQYLPYIIETALNEYDDEFEKIKENLDVASLFKFINKFDLHNLGKTNLLYKYQKKVDRNTSLLYQALQDIKQNETASEYMFRYYLIYCLLLKTIVIENSSKKSFEYKIGELMDFITRELKVYLENEVLICALFLNKNPEVEHFFRSAKINSKKMVRSLKGMAWDFFHLMMLREVTGEFNHRTDMFAFQSFLSYDRGLNDIIKLNPIKRLAIVEKRTLVKYEKNIFEEFPNIDYTSLVTNSGKDLTLEKLKEIKDNLESELIKLQNKHFEK